MGKAPPPVYCEHVQLVDLYMHKNKQLKKLKFITL